MKGIDLLAQWVDNLSALYEKREATNIALESLMILSRFQDQKEFLSSEIKENYPDALMRLMANEPWQYVTGTSFFYGLTLTVNPSVLIPRPETEELVHLILKRHPEESPLNILDIGSGSGCIPIALANERPNWNVFAVDISGDALAVAAENAAFNQVKVEFFQADILQTESMPDEQWDVIVSNPPYIPNREKVHMHVNVLNHEPSLALFVEDENPLLFYQKIKAYALKCLKPSGKIYLEINEFYADEMLKLYSDEHFSATVIHQDLYGKPRMLESQKL